MDINRRCDVCNIDVDRTSLAKHFRIRKHVEDINQNYKIIPDWLFQEPYENLNNTRKKIHNPKASKQIATEKININDKQLSKGLAKRMFKPYYFLDRILTTAFNIFVDSHHINHIKSKINNERK